jgi:hypothetical protein
MHEILRFGKLTVLFWVICCLERSIKETYPDFSQIVKVFVTFQQ